MNLEYDFILECYHNEIRTILEYEAVIFHSALTKQQSNAVEAIQRKVLFILNGYLDIKLSYAESLIFYSTESLESRRLDICKTFIKRSLKNPNFKHMFSKSKHAYNVRGTTRKFWEDAARTERFQTSPLVYLRRLANQMINTT